ncbi:citrate lyase holo-[acyl-carrier protein] synthase [Spiroplasma sp. DGKH1]|uniref:citrate lyase holo-[acyl-carrier protein] synthase n=1 Tax=Spiroplasma sp. DGKH1 TaxID=3050074 RepID=UPI0034C63B43
MLEFKPTNKILLNREQHYLLQQQLVNKYQAGLLTVNLNIPGAHKQQPQYHHFFQTIIKPQLFAFLQSKGINYQTSQEIYDETGDYLVIVLPQLANYLHMKELLIAFEMKAKIYQLLDFDIYDQHLQAISRQQLNLPMRKCYLCAEPAKWCARQKTHLISELLCYINNVIEEEIERNDKAK